MKLRLFRILDEVPFFEGEVSMLISNGLYSFHGPTLEDKYLFAQVQWHNSLGYDTFIVKVKHSLGGVNIIELLTEYMIFNNSGEYLFSPDVLRLNTGVGKIEILYNGTAVLKTGGTYVIFMQGSLYVFEVSYFNSVDADNLMYGRIAHLSHE